MTSLSEISAQDMIEHMCSLDPSIWAAEKRGFVNTPLQEEWYDLGRQESRLGLVAPREHGKSEVLTVNLSAWESIYLRGIWTYVFAYNSDQARKLKARIVAAVEEARPDLVLGAREDNETTIEFANGSRITVAGAGKAVRGAHPDVIRGDDVLEEMTCLTEHQRKKTIRWWFGTVTNMAHPGTLRLLPDGSKVRFPPTRICLVGTPFHKSDLLMSMRTNELYRFYRYSAEFNVDRLPAPPSLAVEIK